MSDKEMRKIMKAKRPKTSTLKPESEPKFPEQPEGQPKSKTPPKQTAEQTSKQNADQPEGEPQDIPEEKPEKTPFPRDHPPRDPPTTAGPSRAPPTFWPEEAHYPLPFSAYNSFNFKADDSCFSGYTNRELVLAAAIHQGRAMAAFSRLVGRESIQGGSDAKLKKLKAKYKEAKAGKKKIKQEKEGLKATILALQQEAIKANKIKSQALEEQQRLEEENAALARKLEEQVEQNQEMKNSADQMVTEIKRQHTTLSNSLKVINDLERANEHLKQQARTGTPELRQQLVEEYQSSPELLERILEQYGKGFQAAVDKATKAGVNPTIFSDSDDDSPEA